MEHFSNRVVNKDEIMNNYNMMKNKAIINM